MEPSHVPVIRSARIRHLAGQSLSGQPSIHRMDRAMCDPLDNALLVEPARRVPLSPATARAADAAIGLLLIVSLLSLVFLAGFSAASRLYAIEQAYAEEARI